MSRLGACAALAGLWIGVVRPAAPVPLTIGLLLDGSRSMPGRLGLSTIGDDIGGNLIAGDRLFVYGVGRTLWKGRGALRSASAIDGDVFRYDKSSRQELGPSPLWDQIQEAAADLPRNGPAPALLVLSDGRAIDSLSGADDAAHSLVAARVRVFALVPLRGPYSSSPQTETQTATTFGWESLRALQAVRWSRFTTGYLARLSGGGSSHSHVRAARRQLCRPVQPPEPIRSCISMSSTSP